ncbi:MAG: tRNA lysidine(34) synthetase TilS [Lachnospiraceae bacterium]|nr:tRNA lysidine(34) synthetase TilS [Lachnospiraceae bacterium]
MERKVRNFIEENHLIESGDRIVAGVSGGADSTALFYILLALREELGFSFSVIHINHGIRGDEARRDELFVSELAARHGIPVRTAALDVPGEARRRKIGLEEAGRILRRQEYEKELIRSGADKIALAHHEDDLSETMLMNLARGTGLAGLAGIRPQNGKVIRPLLCAGRKEIEAYLARIGAAYVTDSTNAEVSYTRNRVRNILIPSLEEHVNKGAGRHLAEAAREAGQAYDILNAQALGLVRKLGKIETLADGRKEAFLPAALFEGLPELLGSYCIRAAYYETAESLKDLSRIHIRKTLSLLTAGTGKEISLPGGLTASRRQEGLRIGPPMKETASYEEYSLPVPGELSCLGWTFRAEFVEKTGEMFREKQCTKWIDYGKIKGSLTVRCRRTGDYIVIHPDGRRKSISDLMTDRKVPGEMRKQLPLLAVGQEILLVPGIRSGESARVDGTTEKILLVRAQKDGKDEEHGREDQGYDYGRGDRTQNQRDWREDKP